MDKNTPLHLQEIIFSSSNSEISRTISTLVKGGKLKKVAPRIYTSNLEDDEAVIIQRNLFKIIGHLYKGALLSHRSAFEYRPTSSGDIFLTYSHDRKIKLPGVTLNYAGRFPAYNGRQYIFGRTARITASKGILGEPATVPKTGAIVQDNEFVRNRGKT